MIGRFIARKIRWVLLILSIGGLILGGQGLYRYLTLKQPVKMTLAEYEKTRPPVTWVRFEECALYLPGVSHDGRFGMSPGEAFFPVVRRNFRNGDRSGIIVATKDPRLVQFAQEACRDGASAEEALKLIQDLSPTGLLERDVEGLERPGLETSSRLTRSVDRAAKIMGMDFVIINEGDKPTLNSLFFLGGGIISGIAFLVAARNSDQPAPPGAQGQHLPGR